MRVSSNTIQPGTVVGRFRVVSLLGAGGPPPLNAACGRSFGASAVAQTRPRR
jgi:hypothetical protein